MVENAGNVAEDIVVKKHTETVDDVSREQKVQDVEVIISVVEQMPASAVESKLEDGKLGKIDASLTSPDALAGELTGEFQEEDEEVEAIMEAKVANKIADDVETAVAENEKPEQEGEKVEKVALGEKKEAKVPIVSIGAAEIEDILAPFTEANDELLYQKESSNDIMVMGGEEVLEELIQKVVDVPMSETGIVVVNDGSTEEVVSSSADSVLEDSLWLQLNAEGQATATKVVDDIGVKKSLEFENIVGAIEYVDVKIHKEAENVVVDTEKHTETLKDDVSREPMVQDTNAIISMVEPVPILAMDSNLETNEWGEGDASLASPNALEGDKRGELW
ncbi:hypothetical protein PVAP13_3NG206763 [Panicum virgatum]|uniref:Uncharacterized protein n=1 Tax=Panicum virgatum TaxID=38727 RepID=A0A8T0U2B7_PANVG|nr:hypothetical protein PVAP13_3NG206763 [Panicum virgatum]